ncbi:MAG TPA: heat-inducible transcriptional repressor HrcA [Solirubrobacteraceae bacterium]|jgi:heat-inducible transcriptional repressor|nr:heat-inducible transcriptional repressor HrcA [Solirubrobacteraceae bacterium]
MLTPRQETILRKVVDSYAATGQPVASKTLAADPNFDCGPSTIRYELALLEAEGLLAHPHTSAGRLPTDAGQRYLVDRLLAAPEQRGPVAALDLTHVRRELDDALRVTTETLSEITNLLAVATAPAIDNATIRRIEVLTLQPSVVMVVIITSSGGVSKFVGAFETPIDSGLVTWAGEYLNERVGGLPLGARMLLGRLADPELSARERAFIDRLAPAFTELAGGGEDMLYVDGTSRLLGARRFADPADAGELLAMLEERVALLEVMRRALGEPGVFVRIGAENDVPGLQSLSVVASGYGLAQRKLGTISVIGPVRMDYAVAIDNVRAVARELSRFVQDVY